MLSLLQDEFRHMKLWINETIYNQILNSLIKYLWQKKMQHDFKIEINATC